MIQFISKYLFHPNAEFYPNFLSLRPDPISHRQPNSPQQTISSKTPFYLQRQDILNRSVLPNEMTTFTLTKHFTRTTNLDELK